MSIKKLGGDTSQHVIILTSLVAVIIVIMEIIMSGLFVSLYTVVRVQLSLCYFNCAVALKILNLI